MAAAKSTGLARRPGPNSQWAASLPRYRTPGFRFRGLAR